MDEAMREIDNKLAKGKEELGLVKSDIFLCLVEAGLDGWN
jgi:hypothetical protein